MALIIVQRLGRQDTTCPSDASSKIGFQTQKTLGIRFVRRLMYLKIVCVSMYVYDVIDMQTYIVCQLVRCVSGKSSGVQYSINAGVGKQEFGSLVPTKSQRLQTLWEFPQGKTVSRDTFKKLAA